MVSCFAINGAPTAAAKILFLRLWPNQVRSICAKADYRELCKTPSIAHTEAHLWLQTLDSNICFQTLILDRSVCGQSSQRNTVLLAAVHKWRKKKSQTNLPRRWSLCGDPDLLCSLCVWLKTQLTRCTSTFTVIHQMLLKVFEWGLLNVQHNRSLESLWSEWSCKGLIKLVMSI